ncbi:diacylglycerol/lipid kinase family protein [Lacimicrobium alkaliphilum]|uniref:Diacylglycerol kinase n=1 Tax=Lacimicrobium alkaliphilum TaxID=1526571 RepID=A0ABQ1QW43_9ALTE|nr:diacylglycerol kinase family protein [Lacimicrobium alkaliphilum]GGD49113.1 diacylglycerol kinase [Lacimicrobium alkaliphilum]
MSDSLHSCRFLIIINPLASGSAERYREQLTERLDQAGTAFDIWYTTDNDQANQRHLQQCTTDYSDWVVIGGDGTLNLAVNALAGTDVILGLLPCGSGNDFARNLYRKGDDPIEVVLGEHSRRIDLGLCNDRYFVNVLGLGFDGEIVAGMYDHQPRTLRRWRYLMAAVVKLLHYKEQPIALKSPHRSKKQQTFMVAFANGRYFGGGMKIAPKADLSDGLLDCCWIGKASLFRKFYYLWRVFTGSHLSASAVDYWQDNTFNIDTPDLPIEGDGEFFGTSPASISCCASALALKVPRKRQPE